MKLKAGYNAQDFTATDIYGNLVKLSDYKGKKIILSFYRNVSCPFCNRRVHKIMTYRPWLQKSDTQVVFVFESSNKKLSESIFHQGIAPFPLIGDPNKELYQLYGVEESLLGVLRTHFSSNLLRALQETKVLNLPEDKEASDALMPADFLIDENFKITKAHYGKHLDDHISMEEFKQFAGISHVGTSASN